MASERMHGFDLVDRIAALEDPGRIAGATTGQPTNATQARRARLRGAERAHARGWPGELAQRRFLHLLEEMLRGQAGVHVRLPSHHAAPYRAVPFAVDLGPFAFDLDGPGSAHRIDLIDGAVLAAGTLPDATLDVDGSGTAGARVPAGHRAVLTHVMVAHTLLAVAALSTVSSHAMGLRFNVYRNGMTMQGLRNRMPSWWYESQEIAGVQSDIPYPPRLEAPQNLLWHPINLEQHDQVTADFLLPATNAGLANLDSIVYAKFGGYLYPTRIDEPSIRGTIVD